MYLLGTRRQRTESAKKEICFMSGTTATIVVNHRPQEVLLLHFEQQYSMNFPCLRGLQTFFQLRSGLRKVASTLPEQSNSEDVSLSMSGRACQDVGNAPVQELEDHFTRYRNSPAMHDAFPAQYMLPLFRGRVLVAFPTPTKSIRFPRPRGFNLSHSKRRCQDSEQSAAGYVACTMRRLPQGMGTFLLTRLEPYQLFVCRERNLCTPTLANSWLDERVVAVRKELGFLPHRRHHARNWYEDRWGARQCAGTARIALQLSIGSGAHVLVAECDSFCDLRECLECVRVDLTFAKMVVMPAIGLSLATL